MERARYIGVDLAGGERNRTGVAILDEAGRLVESASVRTDTEIAAMVNRHHSDTVVAAVDAPLIVPNETGRRPCETLVGQHFARFGAGAYPANRANPNFTAPRGARLAAALGWEMNPAVAPEAGRRVCIEVYPHPAMVSLFGLAYVIPYKIKPGRDVTALKDAYERLLDHIEGTCGAVLELDASPRWSSLRQAAVTATRKSELDAIEDEIDAIFCAYLAWLWTHEPAKMIVLGDYATGYIVTPPPPAATVGSQRPARQAAPPDSDTPHERTQRLAAAFRAAVPSLSVAESQTLAKVAADLSSRR